MLNLTDSVTAIHGISEKRAGFYMKLGIETVNGLLSHYPRSYIDFTTSVPVGTVGQDCDGEYAVIRARVTKKMQPFIGRTAIYKLQLADNTGTIVCTFFNCDFSFNRLVIDKEYIFYGKISVTRFGQEIINPIYIFTDEPNKLTPKYRLTKGLTHAVISSNVKVALSSLKEGDLPDLPDEIIKNHNLMTCFEATRKIHFPSSTEESVQAKRSLVFKELLVLQLGLSIIRCRNRKLTGTQAQLPFDFENSELYKSLPFKPTNAQIRAIDDCVRDMKKAVPMNRLLQGDVGSGKTLVAAALAFYAHLNGFQTALMVPTEILAKQHYKTLCEFLEPHGIKVELIVGGLSTAEKSERHASIKSGEAAVVVGTHALISKRASSQNGIEFNSLGLVVTDEQHRFGVGQRSELISKGMNPHTLVMSATPIPRTLGLIIYGDLDISLLDEMPQGRLPIKTYGVTTSYRERLYKFIIKEVLEGRQAYIVCPLIDDSVLRGDSDAVPKASAVKYYEQLKKHFREIDSSVEVEAGLLHGRMKQAEKDEVMSRFKDGEINVLVSTTVIEVGVDVPNATVMMIENVEQFGLSQLHQLRGRVGRGSVQSHCVLVTDSSSPYTKARVDTMTSTGNGFEIAGKDLELRGPGDFFGSKQHGLPMLKVGDLASDTKILEETQTLAKSIIKSDPQLTAHHELKQLVDELFKDTNEYGYN
jgi:ATP-dependent DNA helicase RecG